MSLSTQERDLYSNVWQGVDDYGVNSPGEKILPIFLQIGGDQRGRVLDAGCGSGKGALALKAAGFDVTMCDLTNEGLVEDAQAIPFVEAVLWRMPKTFPLQFDWVYCCDVMEHIPTQMVAQVVNELLKLAPKVFFCLSNTPDQFGAWVGQPLHQTVQPFTWWRDTLRELGNVTEARDLIGSSVFVVERR